jgi:SAM-dependent methyltransferase
MFADMNEDKKEYSFAQLIKAEKGPHGYCNPIAAKYFSSEIRRISSIIPTFVPQKILDIGTGKGHFVLECSKLGLDVIGLDIRPLEILLKIDSNEKWDWSKHYGESFYRNESIYKTNPSLLIKGDAFNMPFNEGTFDLVFSHLFFEHLIEQGYSEEEMKTIFQNISGILKPDGLIWAPSCYEGKGNFNLSANMFNNFFNVVKQRNIEDTLFQKR